jgi:hypothetical protein
MKYLRILAAALAVFLGVTLTGCSSGPAATYAPAAYGQNGQCYYLDDPYEAQQLLAAGLCPAGWVPAPMPLSWEEMYFSYYDSPAYYSRYVLVSHRTVYLSHEAAFHTTYASQISAASKSATYKGSNGKTVTGTTAKMKFSTGSGSTGTAGGGSLRRGTTGTTGGSKGTVTTRTKTTSGGTSGGSLRGGRK